MNINRLLFTALILLNFACIGAMERGWIYEYAVKPKEEKLAEAKAEQAKRATNQLKDLLLAAPPASLENVGTGFWSKKEQNDFFKKIKELLDAGANPNGIFMLTSYNNRYKLFNTGSETTLLKYAILLEYPELVQILLEHGADANLKQAPLASDPLMLVLTRLILENDTTVQIISLLLKHHANPNVNVLFTDEPPLLMMVRRDNLPAVKLLLQYKADPNFKYKNGSTLLFYPHTPEIMQLLLDHGVDPNIKNQAGETPLIVNTGSGNLAKILLDNGADVNIQNGKGLTPLMLSAHLIDHQGYPTDGPARMFIERGAQLNIQDKYGNTALIHAVLHDNEPMVRLLLENGADINTKNKKDDTALILAIKNGKTKMAHLLLENGADQTITNDERKTALDIAEEKKDAEMINLLKNPPPLKPVNRLILRKLF